MEARQNKETESKYQLIIGTAEFGLTEKDVLEAIEEAKEILKVCKEDLANAKNKREREKIQRRLSYRKKMFEALSSRTPEELLQQAKSMYDGISELEKSGPVKERLDRYLGNETVREIELCSKLYQQNKRWGEPLVQRILNEKIYI